MQCLHCRIIIQLGHWHSSPPVPNQNYQELKKKVALPNSTGVKAWWYAMRNAQFSGQDIQLQQMGGFGGIQRRKKANQGKELQFKV